MKVVHAYPGLSAHIREVLLGFQEAGDDLDVFATLMAREDRGWERAAIARLARRWGRANDYLFPTGPRTRLHRRPVWDILRVIGDRSVGRGAADRLWEVKSREFDRWVASNLRPGADAVVGYEHSCLLTFRRARKLGVPAVYHMLATHYDDARLVLKEQNLRFSRLLIPADSDAPVERQRNRHKAKEYSAADGFVAISRYSATTLLARGYPADRVAVVPLGAPPINPGWRDVPRSGPLTFLFVGNFSYGKGIPQLLRVWREARPGDARLWLAGRWGFDPPAEWRGLSGVEELGFLDRQALFRRYQEADVLVFPTLRDGFGMVVTEALANGLPVLTTTSAGAADLIREGENGWVIPPFDEAALSAALAGCAADPSRVRGMRGAAMATAAARPWAAYRTEFVRAVQELVARVR